LKSLKKGEEIYQGKLQDAENEEEKRNILKEIV